jgi:Neuraminidase (sialidase)
VAQKTKSASNRGDHSEINILLCPATIQEPRQSENSILPFADGRLLLGYSRFTGGNWRDFGPAHIAGRWSHDEGRTWSEPLVLQENIAQLNCMSPSLLRLRSGRVLMIFSRRDGQPGVPGGPPFTQAMAKWSDDECRTWTDPIPLMPADQYWDAANDRLVQLASGRVLWPAKTGGPHCACFRSDDDGETWQMSARNVAEPEGIEYAEPILIELKNGSVDMYIRNRSGNLHIASSWDGGDTWTMRKNAPPNMSGRSDTGPNAAHAPCQIKRIPGTGDLLLVWNNNRTRTPLTAAVSSDEGGTWKHFRNIEEMDGWPPRLTHCYSSVAFLSGNVHLTYWEAQKRDMPDEHFLSLRYRRLPISWFYERP